jgi:hypothetical protein
MSEVSCHEISDDEHGYGYLPEVMKNAIPYTRSHKPERNQGHTVIQRSGQAMSKTISPLDLTMSKNWRTGLIDKESLKVVAGPAYTTHK